MLYNALIRTHHITSRKKVSALKRAADTYHCSVLLRSGGIPGIMYVEGREKNDVESWVGVVKGLKYKDFQLVARPGPLEAEDKDKDKNGNSGRKDIKSGKKKGNRAAAGTGDSTGQSMDAKIGLEEVESVKDFGGLMAQKGVWRWWRRGMGYENTDG
ncbi:hypothetical protein MPDQ_001227 [Monascus purpureus]|uniref:Uncharacterized protein n=1 Tax=Monascus purpureus TaxID=5098 RepID=A0A507QN56_MONPU|nr:hypothetical protein MPDQ_001227 [Monascus purpureus]BDD59099.1 hypothetical protein MAP00_004337 [Monascus purpureus]